LILALPGLGDTHTRNSGIHLTVSQYSLGGCEPNTVLMAKNDTLGEAWPHAHMGMQGSYSWAYMMGATKG